MQLAKPIKNLLLILTRNSGETLKTYYFLERLILSSNKRISYWIGGCKDNSNNDDDRGRGREFENAESGHTPDLGPKPPWPTATLQSDKNINSKNNTPPKPIRKLPIRN